MYDNTAIAGETRFRELANECTNARTVMARVDGIIRHIIGGEWDDRLGSESAAALVRRLRVMSETVRLTRATVDGFQGDEYPRWPWQDHALPLNRKERFWTGTVLPAGQGLQASNDDQCGDGRGGRSRGDSEATRRRGGQGVDRAGRARGGSRP